MKKKDVEWKCKNKNIIVKIYYQALIYKFLYVTKTEVFKLFAFARVLLCGVWCVRVAKSYLNWMCSNVCVEAVG